MKRFISLLCIFTVVLTVAGCAKKTASEQLKDDMKKASDQMNKEVQGLLK